MRAVLLLKDKEVAVQSIQIRVNDELTLDAGIVRASDEQDARYEITPPVKPMLDQVIVYLNSKPPLPYEGIRSSRSGVGLTALCIRWGSYLATLMDSTAVLHPDIP